VTPAEGGRSNAMAKSQDALDAPTPMLTVFTLILDENVVQKGRRIRSHKNYHTNKFDSFIRTKLNGGLEERIRRMEALFMSDPLLVNLDGAPGNSRSHFTTFPDASPHSDGQPPDLGLTGRTATYRSHGEQNLRFAHGGNTISLTSAQDSDQTLDLLFTGKNGEAEFIGICTIRQPWEILTMSRFGVRAVDILAQGHGLGQ